MALRWHLDCTPLMISDCPLITTECMTECPLSDHVPHLPQHRLRQSRRPPRQPRAASRWPRQEPLLGQHGSAPRFCQGVRERYNARCWLIPIRYPAAGQCGPGHLHQVQRTANGQATFMAEKSAYRHEDHRPCRGHPPCARRHLVRPACRPGSEPQDFELAGSHPLRARAV